MSVSQEHIAYKGSLRTIEYAVLRNGDMPAMNFFCSLTDNEQEKVIVLFRKYGEQGKISNEEQFKNLEDGLWEFKRFKIRFICFFHIGGRVILTHGFIKKRDKTPREEIERAKRFRAEFLSK